MIHLHRSCRPTLTRRTRAMALGGRYCRESEKRAVLQPNLTIC